MIFHSVGHRCAIHPASWNIPLSTSEILHRLTAIGFQPVAFDLAEIAVSLVSVGATYLRHARQQDAPKQFNCSGLVKWIYAQQGVWIPQYSPHQFAFARSVSDDDIRAGDLVFSCGAVCPPIGDATQRVSHVGICVDRHRLLHASPENNIAFDDVERWHRSHSWRGARRIFPDTGEIITLQTPTTFDIETSDDVFWKILETTNWSLPSIFNA